MPRKRSLLPLVLAASLLVTSPARAQVGLTVFNDGRVLVRRTVQAELRKGETTLDLALGPVDPATLFPLDTGVTILGATWQGAVDEASVARRAMGRKLTFLSGRDTIRAELAGLDPERYRMADGSIHFGRPGTGLWPADLALAEPGLTLRVSSTRQRQKLALGYFSSSGGWSASYHVVTAPKGAATVSGQAVINAGPLKAKEATLQLLAGDPGRAAPGGRFAGAESDMMVARAAMAKEAGPAEASVGDVHIYTLPGRVTIEPGTISTVQLFPPASAAIAKTYEARSQNPYYGPLPQYGDPMESPVEIAYTLRRPHQTEFGDRPLPGGTVRIYQPDSAGQLQLVAESSTGHTAGGEDLRIRAGVAFDLGATRVQTSYTTGRDTTGGRRRTVATADYRVTLTNARAEAVTIDVLEERAGEWSVVSSSVPVEKLSSTRARFRVTVPAAGEAVLTYRLRALW